MAILTVQQLTKVYEGKQTYRALDRVSFAMDQGEFVGIMGPSGSGKTTLLNMVSTMNQPTSGEVWLNGENVSLISQKDIEQFRRQHLGFVFQHFALLDTLTVEENILLPLILDGKPIDEMKRQLHNIATRLDIQTLLQKQIDDLSGGQKQRTAIARAIIHSPTLLLADEPTGNLDSKSTKDVLEVLLDLNRERATSILMVSHDPLVASYCDRVLFMKDGQLYNELYQGEDREAFFRKLLDMLALLGGDRRDFLSVYLPKHDS
ncbi:putative ABC transport system ATP-binding protein [Seinonella peptonophila]|uniref:Putative ABC transport system ATP-binding protein n=1 Tax=Seinonella peptonophila TaxID=112248 RepID=A0A1M4X3T5_9BACL|nr:ABC transporter ATP-binding protein [Seinonella peptonophila]SHE87882.1 putative ABC transport system ATP-binding protein [Seinonella peptonophila]